MTLPITFTPVYMERVWGGRHLETIFGRTLPEGKRVGESWEVVDRPEAQSVVSSGGPWHGMTLHQLWSEHRGEVFGERYRNRAGRFPLLVKLLDAVEPLSVQVHPPVENAAQLGGEPKTEMWYIAAAEPDAVVYAGLKAGSSRTAFEEALAEGRVAELLHCLPTRAGDCLFIPSGRVHAIGGGNVIIEVQQNSDTTYRVFDWNRTGLDGKPRQLHVRESLESIRFDDYEPEFQPKQQRLVETPYFLVDELALSGPLPGAPEGEFALFVPVFGGVVCHGRTFGVGTFFLMPATQEDRILTPAADGARLLRITLP